jgi:hypothetical protein
MKGIKFVTQWYGVDHIPANKTLLYQLLLKLIWMKGTMTQSLVRRLGYTTKLIRRAFSQGYISINTTATKPSREVYDKIVEMIGEAPGWMYI